MTYSEWNEHIAKYFFKPENAGRDILFYLTKEELIKSSRQHFNGEPDGIIWADFINGIKYGNPTTKVVQIPYSPIARPNDLFSKWNKIDTPPFIAFLILYIIPLTESYEEPFNAINFYGKVNVFFSRYEILNQYTEQSIGTGNFQNISHLWNDLEEWSIITKNCDLGIFELKKFGNPNWIHVGKPFSLCILTPRSISKLPELYYEAGLIPNSNYSMDEFRKILIKYGAKILLLKDSIIELIKRSETNELGQAIIEMVIREYGKWTGETHQEGDNLQRTRRNYTVAPLFLQFKVNENAGLISISFRLYSANDYPEDLKLGIYENIYESNGWSKTLKFEFKESFEIQDSFNKWVARFPDRDVRLFVNAGTYQLSTDYWIETESLSKIDTMFLLCKTGKRESIIEWGKSFRSGNFKVEDFEGLPENYALFKILNPVKSHPDIPLLTLYTGKRIELTGGLKVNFRTLINDSLPEVEITNSDGNENVYLQYRNTVDKLFLIKKQSNSNRWLLPADILLDFDFYIKVEGENFAGNEIAYNLISSNGSAIKVDGAQLPKRDSFGSHITSDATQYCLGSNIINPMKASQRYFCPWENLFISLNEDLTSEVTKATSNKHCGNMLSSFLALKNVLTTEEFYRAFEFYYSKQFSKRQASVNFNMTRTKKDSLNFYDYIGILDYDYETKLIVVNPPQFIFIPSNKGRKVLLIGARESSFVNSIINNAKKYNLQVESTKQFSSNEKLLLPDAITIKAFGKRTEGSGERNLISLANEMKIKFSKDDFVQIALHLFSAEIKEYEKELLEKNETSQEDYGWARRIFNPENLTYERNESATFDKTFSLIEYKLNEYTYYNKLWKDGKCYQVDKNWGKYLALKQHTKHVILFDSSRKRVAIPLETPLPRLLSESIMLLSGLAPDFRVIEEKYYRVYENIPGIFTENLFHKLGQQPNEKDIR